MALTDKLTAIADAVREKAGTTEAMTLTQIAEAIAGIETGGGGFPNEPTFTLISEIGEYAGFNLVEYGARHLGKSSGKIWTSEDGRTWTNTTTSVSNLELQAVADDMWFGKVSNQGLYYSTDCGATWTKTNLASTYSSFIVFKANHMWFCNAYGGSADDMLYSLDGKSWTKIDGVKAMSSIEYHAGTYIGYPAGNVQVYRSADGINWTAIDQFPSGLYALCFHNGRWFAGKSDVTYYSTDGGNTWVGMDRPYRSIVSNGKVAIGIGYSDKIVYRSTDGVNWVDCGITAPYGVSTYQNGIWYIYSDTGAYLSLDNGTTWVQIPIPEGYKSISRFNSDGVTLMIAAKTQSNTTRYLYAPMFE